MKKKFLIGGLIVCILVLVMGTFKGYNKTIISNKNNSNELTIYTVKNDTVQKRLIRKYKIENSDIKVNEVEFDDYEQYNEALTTDLLVGKGPDVIFAYSAYIERLNKMVEANLFLDINELLKEDKDFNLENYNTVVMDSGVINNKRFLIPFNYYLTTWLALSDTLKSNNIELTGNETVEEIVSASQKYFEDEKFNNDLYFCDNVNFFELLDYEEQGLIDFKNKKTNFNNDDFKQIVESYKKIRLAAPYEELDKYSARQLDMLIANKLLFAGVTLEPTSFYTWVNYILTNSNKDIEMLANVNRGTAYAGYVFAINSNSKNVDSAYDFIKFAMSKEYQEDLSNHNEGEFIPVNNESLSKLKEDMTNKIGGYHYGLIMQELPKGIKEKYEDSLFNFSKCVISDSTLETIIGKELTEYAQGMKSYDDAINEINRKVKLYLNE